MQTHTILSRIQRWKKEFLFCLGLLGAAASATPAAGLTLAWDPSPDAGVTGYVFYYGIKGGTMQKLQTGTTLTANVSSLTAGKTYEFFVTARTADGVESDPSNKIAYTVPDVAASYVTLTIGGFKNGYVQVSPRGEGPAGDRYLVGTQVQLLGTPKADATFASWTINGEQFPANPLYITMNSDLAVQPNFKVPTGSIAQDPGPGGPSLQIGRAGNFGALLIGGEEGAWVLEKSTNLVTWQAVAEGMTSDSLPVDMMSGNGFFRVRTRSTASN